MHKHVPNFKSAITFQNEIATVTMKTLSCPGNLDLLELHLNLWGNV